MSLVVLYINFLGGIMKFPFEDAIQAEQDVAAAKSFFFVSYWASIYIFEILLRNMQWMRVTIYLTFLRFAWHFREEKKQDSFAGKTLSFLPTICLIKVVDRFLFSNFGGLLYARYTSSTSRCPSETFCQRKQIFFCHF